MAFFSKLKDRLFKSSAKIDEGLEAIVQDNIAEETVVVEAPAPPQAFAEPEPEIVVLAEPTVEVVPEPQIEEPAPEPVVKTPPVAPAELAPAAKKSGILGRMFGQNETKEFVRRVLDDEMLEQLEELLISTDMGVDTALRVTANMAEGRMGKKLSVDEIKSLLAAEITRIMEPVARPLPIYPKTPQVVLVVGVNGSGKTTTIGKLASQFRAAGKKRSYRCW